MTLVRAFLVALAAPAAAVALAAGAAAQTAAPDPKARCAQLVELWERYSTGKSEGGGSMDMPRKSAVADCEAGRTEAGIRTLEDLLRRNGYKVPPP
ncbi:MAG: hypothetical protein K2Y40_01355 [Reyranella sp.]|nr:hypothetical protein [Reyranella sp.]